MYRIRRAKRIVGAFAFIVCLATTANAEMIVQTAVNPANGHTYHAIGGDAGAGTTWTASEAFVETLRGHLATIDDASENAWIASTFFDRYYVWIGLNDIDQEGKYVGRAVRLLATRTGIPASRTIWAMRTLS